MSVARLCLNVILLLAALTLGAYLFAVVSSAQTKTEHQFKPDVRGAQRKRMGASPTPRTEGHTPQRSRNAMLPTRPRAKSQAEQTTARHPARVVGKEASASGGATNGAQTEAATPLPTRIAAGTSLSRVMHTSQLSITSSAGSNEQYVDRNFDLSADERTTFDNDGGSFDNAVGRSGSRYEVFTAINDNATPSNLNDDFPIGLLVVAGDTNGDFVRDSSSSYDLERDFHLPSAIAVVSGTSNAGREFVVVSSSGFYGGAGNPDNEPTAGVVLLVRDPATGGFDTTRSRSLVAPGNNQLNNANALALLPNNDLLIADFDSNELRVVRDTNSDGLPDTLDPVPFYSYRFSDDAPLDIATNSRGLVFSHSVGNDAVMLALYDDNNDGRADRDEVVVEGLSLDNNLVFHGLTVDREGTVYVIEDASGQADLLADGGNLGAPRIDAFPDPALNGFPRDGSIFAETDQPNTQALSGLAFGTDSTLGAVGHLTMTNSASRQGNATRNGLATILGANLTRGAQGASEADASARAVQVSIEGRFVPVFSFNDSQINVQALDAATGAASVVVYVNGAATAADDVAIANDNPGIFTVPQTGAGEAVALLASGLRYTKSPFPSQLNGQPSVITLFGTGWRNSLPVTVRIGGQTATVEYAGSANVFPSGLDQLNVRLPAGLTGAQTIVLTTASGATSRSDVFVTIQ
ncbi:MAG: large repetitive protein [Blastocatellia bacterium]|jgi:uncharacterized protein (TIGR03437 family)|nr:large repetitive protein [Blastocatellia bacterium]